MKKIYSIVIVLLCGLAMLGCQADNTTDIAAGEHFQLTISLPETKTTLGEKVNGIYRVNWSEGDCIGVNGVQSQEAEINAEDMSCATFSFDKEVSYPLNITYPYISATTVESPKVVLPTEQSYVEGTFAQGAAPMCGYVANKGDKVALTHLAGVLRFSVKATTEGTTLQKIVITSTDGAKLSGEFEVNCSAGTMTAGADAASSITYTLPDNFTLSTSAESVFYITLPAGNTGDCEVAFVESSGEKMVCTWESKDIKAGIVREFKTITYKRGASVQLEWLGTDYDGLEIFYSTVFGYVKDINGNPIKGVAVSDGFTVVATDENGYYKMSVSDDAWYIYISLPAGYEVPINEYGQPCFYKKIPSSSAQFDFTLTPLANGKEKKFALFTIGDPQVKNTSQFARFDAEAVPAIYKHGQEVASQGIPCYGITLGDIIANSDGVNTNGFRDDMRDAFHRDHAGMPVFHVFGNHDSNYFGDGVVIEADDRSSTFELKAQRDHEEIFGPVNYSFNRGDIHIVSMRNIVYQRNDASGKYAEGFLKEQYDWLKQDLALVPKDQMVILCVHAPLYRNTGNYVEEVQALLNEYKEAHIISGHTHYSRNYEYVAEDPNTLYPNLYDHNVGALCGVWWRGNIACDGAPTGYNVFICEDGEFKESYFMGVNEGMNTKEKQMRLYRGDAVTGREKLSSDTYAGVGYYAFNFGEDVLLANIYNGDRKWTIQVYEDGIYTGNMELVEVNLPAASTMIGDYSLANPRRLADGVEASIDMYTAGFYYSYYSGRSAWSICYHLYKYKLKNNPTKILVKATDRYGNLFVEDEITEGTDYSLVKRN